MVAQMTKSLTIANAKLPASYANAKLAIAKCERIDECKDWANKAEALASYAKQAGDQSLLVMSKRIQSRALRRCGELLLQLKRPEQGGRPRKNGVGTGPVSRKQAAEKAGLSKRQQKTAVRVARVPGKAFEAAVESANPPTVTKLAKEGTRTAEKPHFDLQGRNEKDFKISTRAQGEVRLFADFASKVNAEVAARGSLPNEWEDMLQHSESAMQWLVEFQRWVGAEKEKTR
jgi:hypothetical protein